MGVVVCAIVIAGAAIFLVLNAFKNSGGSSNATTLQNLPLANGKLTEAQAQRALNQFLAKFSGQAQIKGIQEVPQESAAKVDIKFTNFKYPDQVWGNTTNYSDLGTAIFSKYNDGRWALTRVDVPGYYGNHWNVNIPAE